MSKTSSPVCIRCGAPKDGPCLPCKRASAREYIARNKEKVRAKNNEWKDRNKVRVDAASARYLVENKEAIRLKRAEYHLQNKEKHNQRSAEWRAANPEKCRIQMHNRRAKVRQAGGKLSPGLFAKLFKLQRGKCACCGEQLGDNPHMDHIVPIAMGGCNEDFNIQLLRQTCNNNKHAKDPIEFMQSKGFLL